MNGNKKGGSETTSYMDGERQGVSKPVMYGGENAELEEDTRAER